MDGKTGKRHFNCSKFLSPIASSFQMFSDCPVCQSFLIWFPKAPLPPPPPQPCLLPSLADELRGLPLLLMRKFATDLLLGLRYMHGHGLLHRDVKGGTALLADSLPGSYDVRVRCMYPFLTLFFAEIVASPPTWSEQPHFSHYEKIFLLESSFSGAVLKVGKLRRCMNF